MKKNIVEFIFRYLCYSQVKSEHLRPGGLLQRLPIIEWKWELITKYFVISLVCTSRGSNCIRVIIYWLTIYAQFLSIRSSYRVERLDQIYV